MGVTGIMVSDGAGGLKALLGLPLRVVGAAVAVVIGMVVFAGASIVEAVVAVAVVVSDAIVVVAIPCVDLWLFALVPFDFKELTIEIGELVMFAWVSNLLVGFLARHFGHLDDHSEVNQWSSCLI